MRFGKIAKLCVEEVAIFLRRYVPASHVVDSAEDRECRKRLNGLHSASREIVAGAFIAQIGRGAASLTRNLIAAVVAGG
jgi:hypothetical protein